MISGRSCRLGSRPMPHQFLAPAASASARESTRTPILRITLGESGHHHETRRGEPVEVPILRALTTIGSSAEADIRLLGVPAQWLVVVAQLPHGASPQVEVRVVATDAAMPPPPLLLRIDEPRQLGLAEVQLTWPPPPLPLDELATQLADAETATAALDIVLDAMVQATAADVGVLIVSDRGAFSVVAARDAAGQPLADAHALLSDTLIRDALAEGDDIVVANAGASPYAAVHSVVALGLSAMACFPLRIAGRTLGAIFLGQRKRAMQIAPLRFRETKIIAALAMPLVVQLKKRAPQPIAEAALLGHDEATQALRRLIARIAPTDLTVYVHGASGSGKEVVARALHAQSTRAKGPFVAINCAAIAPSLLDGELFGYRKGAFTGALADRAGLIEAAHGGVLFLDEIGDMPLAMQAALLRVLEQREVRRIGEATARPVDFRLVAATHRDLAALVAAGSFREDLMFRIAEVTIAIPALAARGDDVLLLAQTFLRQTEAQLGLAAHELSDEAIQALRQYGWPGNVRELRACMRRAAVLADETTISAADLQLPMPERASPAAHATAHDAAPTIATAAPGSAAATAGSTALAGSALNPSSAATRVRQPLGPSASANQPMPSSSASTAPQPTPTAAPSPSPNLSTPPDLGDASRPLDIARDDFVRRYVQAALDRNQGNREAAARELGIGVRTLYRYIEG